MTIKVIKPGNTLIALRLNIKLLKSFDDVAWKRRQKRSDYIRMAMEEVVKRGGLESEVQK